MSAAGRLPTLAGLARARPPGGHAQRQAAGRPPLDVAVDASVPAAPARPAGGRAARCGRPAPARSGRSAGRGRGRPVARASSSMSTGAGPRAASSRARSSAPTSRHAGCAGPRSVAPGGSLRRCGVAADGLAQHRRQGLDDVLRLGDHAWRPSLSRRLVPSARGSSGWPGTANTSRPCSAAMRAVISVPDAAPPPRSARPARCRR